MSDSQLHETFVLSTVSIHYTLGIICQGWQKTTVVLHAKQFTACQKYMHCSTGYDNSYYISPADPQLIRTSDMIGVVMSHESGLLPNC